MKPLFLNVLPTFKIGGFYKCFYFLFLVNINVMYLFSILSICIIIGVLPLNVL